MNYNGLTIIIPTLNEERNIGRMLKRLQGLYSNINIIVVDDGSKDKTQEIVRKFGNKRFILLDRGKEKVKGLTASVVDAVANSKTKYFIVIDCDFQHPPEKISEMYYMLKNGDDIVVGTRVKEEGWGVHRKIISFIAISLGRMRLLFNGVRCKDVVSGFFGSKTKLFNDAFKKKGDKFELVGYKVLFDLLKYVENGVKIAEVEYEFLPREEGESKLGKRQIFSYLKSILK